MSLELRWWLGTLDVCFIILIVARCAFELGIVAGRHNGVD